MKSLAHTGERSKSTRTRRCSSTQKSFKNRQAATLNASQQLRQQVVEVTQGVHVAVGFGLANSILIEGDDGNIIVDTLESSEAAVPVKASALDPSKGVCAKL